METQVDKPRLSTADQRVKFYQALTQTQLSQGAWEGDLAPAADQGDAEDHTRCSICTGPAGRAPEHLLADNCCIPTFPSHPFPFSHRWMKQHQFFLKVEKSTPFFIHLNHSARGMMSPMDVQYPGYFGLVEICAVLWFQCPLLLDFDLYHCSQYPQSYLCGIKITI